MKFRTEITLPIFDNRISYDDSILTLGSCFADAIGSRLLQSKFNILVNRTGILYHPIPMMRLVDMIVKGEDLPERAMVFHDEKWHSFFHHGKFSDPVKENLVENIQQAHLQTRQALGEARWLILTFGTSFSFVHKTLNLTVANCHKIPSGEFERRRSSTKEIIQTMSGPLDQLLQHNPKLNIILTVSPIRHIRDGLHQNQLSKSTLLLAAEALCQHDRISYFPSYEIVMDDLRDYRYYREDLIHLTDFATQYIWEKFKSVLIKPKAAELMIEIQKITDARKHRITDPTSVQSQKFGQQQLESIRFLQKRQPGLNFEEELAYFSNLTV